MRVKTIPSGWIRREGQRLDCGPYMSGALESKIRLEEMSCEKHRLADLTAGHAGGIYNGPQFSRNFVDSPEFGVPFLGSSSMLRADLSSLPLLRKSDALSPKLSYLRVRPGMTLISCSGTIGRMVYARPDMDGMWSSQHILKVVPDPEKILPGYVYAFLSSKYGVPLVTSGTYGAIIRHIEPQHIEQVPVPRLGDAIEQRIHDLVQDAAASISRHAYLMRKATDMLLDAIGLNDISVVDWKASDSHLGWAQDDLRWGTLRAFNYDPRLKKVRAHLEACSSDSLGTLVDPSAFKGHIVFKRIDCEPQYGRLLVGQRQAFQLSPEGRWISNKSIEGLGLVVPPGTTLIPSHGTLGEFELYCRAVYVTPRTSEYAFSGDFYRCIPKQDRIPPGYLFAFMRSRLAFYLLRSMSTGGKQQYQHPKIISAMPVPRLSSSAEEEIAEMVDEAALRYDQGLASEDSARLIVERAIEEAA